MLRTTGTAVAAAASGLGIASTGTAAAESSDPDIDVTIGFDDSSYADRFSRLSTTENNSLVESDRADSDASLAARFDSGDHYGTSMRYRFYEEGYEEPETLHFRYYVYFPTDFEVVRNGGKLPGPAGTYDTAGWGARESDGTNGWSARMSFTPGSDSDHVQVGWYCYHADMGSWGSNWDWSNDDAGDLSKGEWHRITGEVTMNTPGENDGVLRGWANGDLAFEKTDIRFRDTTDLKVQGFWFNAYYGGSWSSPSDNEIRFDDLQLVTDPDEFDSDSGSKEHTELTGDENLLAFISEEDSSAVTYDFTAEGPIEFTTAPYDTPSGRPIEGGTWSGVDYVEEDGDRWTAGGGTGEGYGDAFLFEGPIHDVTLDAPEDMWIELDGEEVTPEQLVEHTPEKRLVAFISEEDSSAVTYDFTAEGPVEFTTAPYETPSGRPIEGGTWSGVDYVEEDGDRWTAGGGTGEGYGDAFLVEGPIHEVTLDAPDDMWIELDGEEVTPEQLVERTTEQPVEHTPESRLVAFISEEDGSAVTYDFTAEGPVEFTTAPYETPSGRPIEGGTWSGVDYVEEDGDRWTAGGGTGEGYGDAFLVEGPIHEVTLDVPDDMWIELDGEEVTPEQLVEHTSVDGKTGE
ncbi:polysaccharide lyase [Halorubrum sp. DTA98]|uniref:polysaccharide lyase n=1 Tax=Halorubrum sp. DTA98 TaxID=3402163 RepID=UPI003AAE4C25